MHNNQRFNINTRNVFDISIPYNFNGKQPNFYDVRIGNLEYLKVADKIYSVDKGAGCNVPEININIHCTGTHTECVGHLLKESSNIGIVLKDFLIPTALITIEPNIFGNCNESYHCKIGYKEKVITKKIIKNLFQKWKQFSPKGLIIRTIPNDKEKQFYNYSQNEPPFFTNDAIKYLINIGIEHLVVDLPSIDRIDDKGMLGNHRIFWGGDIDSKTINTKSTNTITELVYINNEIIDGFYFLNLQLPHFVCDAAPSRPIIIAVD